MAEDKFLIRLGADVTALQGDLSKANNTITSWSEKLKSLAGFTIAGAALGTVVSKTMDMVRMGAEAIDGENKLLFALHGRVDVQERLLKQAENLHNTTLFEDDEIIKQQGLLAALGRNEDQIKRIISAAVNLSTATGTDLGVAVEALHKSLSGVGRSLGAIDVEFKTLTETELKNGDAITLVEKKYAGFAKTVAETGSGPLKQFEKQLSDMKENLGREVLPGVNLFIKAFDDLMVSSRATKEELAKAGVNWWDNFGIAADKLRALREQLSNTIPLGPPAAISMKTFAESLGYVKVEATEAQKALAKANAELQKSMEMRRNTELPETTGPVSQVATVDNQIFAQQQPYTMAPIPDKLSATADMQAGLQAQIDKTKELDQATKDLDASTQTYSINLGALAAGALAHVAYGFGQAMVTGQGFGETVLNAVAGFMKSFGEQLIAIGTAKIGLDSLFATGAGGFIALAAGVALVAAAGALNASAADGVAALSSGGSGGFSGGGYYRPGSAGNTQNSTSIHITGRLEADGNQLIAVIDNTVQANQGRRG